MILLFLVSKRYRSTTARIPNENDDCTDKKIIEWRCLSIFFLLYSKVCKANRRSFLFSFNETFLGFGPKITPPPFHKGERLEPARARPVPF